VVTTDADQRECPCGGLLASVYALGHASAGGGASATALENVKKDLTAYGVSTSGWRFVHALFETPLVQTPGRKEARRVI
jgi:hypothetical protein